MLLIATIDPILRCHLQHMLTEKGIPFLLLEEGENIVDFVLSHNPSLVMFDLHLTPHSGLEILRQLRKKGIQAKC